LRESPPSSIFIISKDISLICSVIASFKNYIEFFMKNREKVQRKYQQFLNLTILTIQGLVLLLLFQGHLTIQILF
jgi:hypothetical protein